MISNFAVQYTQDARFPDTERFLSALKQVLAMYGLRLLSVKSARRKDVFILGYKAEHLLRRTTVVAELQKHAMFSGCRFSVDPPK